MGSPLSITEYPDVTSSDGVVVDLTFEQLALKCSKPASGMKHGTFWIRGTLEPTQRKKEHLLESKLLIIDGDKSLTDSDSAPPPDVLSQLLTSWSINHFIYTTHSATQDKNKWRCVIECSLESEEHLKIASKLVCDKLNEFEYPIQWVKEMGSWIQPWFYPRRDDPDDGVFKFYSYLEGTPLEIEKTPIVKEPKVYSTDKGWKAKLLNIASSESFHENLIALTWAAVKDNVDASIIKALAETAMEMVPEANRDERWLGRYSDIGRLISEGILKSKTQGDAEADDLQVPMIPAPVFTHNFPMPSGNMGQLVQSVYNCQHYQYEELAMVTALGLVAGICGRKYNVSGTGLNLYLTLIMGTGMGKDSINEFMERTMVGLNLDSLNAQPMSFLGASRFTGPKALHNGMKNALSQVCVFTEAGLLMSSASGDQIGLTRALLSMYTLSGKGRFSKAELFSDTDSGIGVLHSPALTIVNEATPETLLVAMRDTNAIETGDLPRQSIFRISRPKPYANPDRVFQLTNAVSTRLSELVAECSAIQSDNNHDVINILFADEIINDVKKHDAFWIDKYNENSDANTLAANMATRMHLKAMKFAALCAVLDSSTEKTTTISEAHWNWAKDIVTYEYSGLDKFFAGGKTDVEASLIAVAETIVKVLNARYKDKSQQLNQKYLQRKIITRSVIYQILKHHKTVSGHNYNKNGVIKRGSDVLLSKMVSDGLLKEIDDPFGHKKGCLQITTEFNHVFGQYYLMESLRAPKARKSKK